MYELLSKKGQIVSLGIAVLSMLLFFVPILTGLDAFDALPDGEKFNTNIFNTGFYVTIALLAIAVLGWIVFAGLELASNFQKSLKGVLGFGVLVLLFVVVYMFSEAETTGVLSTVAKDFDLSDNQSRLISTLITSTGILGLASIVILLTFEVRNFFK